MGAKARNVTKNLKFKDSQGIFSKIFQNEKNNVSGSKIRYYWYKKNRYLFLRLVRYDIDCVLVFIFKFFKIFRISRNNMSNQFLIRAFWF